MPGYKGIKIATANSHWAIGKRIIPPIGSLAIGYCLSIPHPPIDEVEMACLCSIIHRILDIQGKMCPYLLMETRDALKTMKAGEVLEVITDYTPAATETIPNFCRRKGYPVEIIDGVDGVYRLLIKKIEVRLRRKMRLLNRMRKMR